MGINNGAALVSPPRLAGGSKGPVCLPLAHCPLPTAHCKQGIPPSRVLSFSCPRFGQLYPGKYLPWHVG